MTSQVGTTAANVATGTFNTVVDVSDLFWKNVLSSTVGEKLADGTVKRRWVGGTLSTLKGMTWGNADSRVLKELLLEEAPIQFKNLFYETTKAMDISGNKGVMTSVARGINILNVATDAVFKEGALYGALDRKLREGGSNLGEFLRGTKPDGSSNTLEDLPEGTLDYAIDYAKRFTFQKDYKKDTSVFGWGASQLQRIHHKAPFLVSVGADIPFPRYIANHLEYINDYTPIGIATGGLEKLNILFGGLSMVGGDVHKSGRDRIARQMTGAMMTMGGFYVASEKEGKIDFDRIVNETGGETDLSRIAGPWAMNLLIGDIGYRILTGKPWNPSSTKKNVLEIAGGIPDLSSGAFKLEFDFIKELVESANQQEATEGMQKILGNAIATFSYPGTIARDLYAQYNYDAAGNPFVRDITSSQDSEGRIEKGFYNRNFLEDIIYSNVLMNQAKRFFVDLPISRLSPKNRGEGYDFKIYLPWNPNPLSSYNPITRQFGAIEEPPSTPLEQEMTYLGIKKYEMYTNKTIPNANVAYTAQYHMSQKMPYMFNLWRRQKFTSGILQGRTYNDLSDEDKRDTLKGWISQTINEFAKASESAYELQLQNPENKKKMISFVSNNYLLEKAKFERKYGNIDRLIQYFPTEFYGATTANEWIEDAGTIEGRIDKIMMIMKKIPDFKY